MTDDTQKDAPLLRCWLKKSWSTSKKVGLWLGGIAVVLIAAYVAWLGLTSQISAKIWAASTGWCGSIISGILNYIATIPPLVFWGSVIVITAIAVILGYSLAWCIARNLQDSDWESDPDINSVLALALALAFAALAALAPAIAHALALAFAALALAFAALALAIAIALVLADNPKSSWYYVFRFIGAYLNYRKRMKATPTASVVEETKE
jgi:hypothetical protein